MVWLATNQGVVGSNPAGRTSIIKGLQISVCSPFSCIVDGVCGAVTYGSRVGTDVLKQPLGDTFEP